jgi:hypothetical protein
MATLCAVSARRGPSSLHRRVSLTVESSLLSEEPDFAVGIATNKTHNDSFFLTSLEAIDATKLDTRKPLLERRKQRHLS